MSRTSLNATVRRRLRAAVAATTALATGLVGLVAAPAAHAADSQPLRTHAVSADLLGVWGDHLVAVSAHGVHLKRPGRDWVVTDLDPRFTQADVSSVADGHLVAVFPDRDTYQVLNLTTGTALEQSVVDPIDGLSLYAATPTTAALASDVEGVQVVLRVGAAPNRKWLTWSEHPGKAVAGKSRLAVGWLNDTAWVAPFRYRDARNRLLLTRVFVAPATNIDGFRFDVNGDVLWAGAHPTTDGVAVRYLSKQGATLKDCTVTATFKPSCRTIRTKVTASAKVNAFGDVFAVTIGSAEYLWEGGKLVKVSGVPKGHSGSFQADGSGRPVLSVDHGGTTDFYRVAAGGKASRFESAVTEPVVLESLDLGTGWVAGTDNGGSPRAWVRARTDGGLGAEKVLSSAARGVRTSAGRYALSTASGLTFFDRGSKKATIAKVRTLGDLSGPYALVETKPGKWNLRTQSRTVAAGIVDPVGQFGSLVARVRESTRTLTVQDYATGSGVPQGEAVTYPAGLGALLYGDLWGDRVLLGFEKPLDDGSFRPTTCVWDFRRATGSVCAGLRLPSLGDGVVTGFDGDWRPVSWNLAGSLGRITDEPTLAPPVVDGDDGVAYATLSDLVVGTVSGAGAVPARVLGWTAPATFNAYNGELVPWSLELDATKALRAAEVRITDSDDALVASIQVNAAPDGSLRDVRWYGRHGDGSDGDVVPSGSYTWTLVAEAADGTGQVRDLSGTEPQSGTITVANKAIVFPQQRPKIEGRSVVGDLLTADPGRIPAISTPHYQWYRGASAVRGATGRDYALTAADLGKKLSVRVWLTGMAPLYRDTKPLASSATAKVGKGRFSPAAVSIDDPAPRQDSAVAAVAVGWDPVPKTVSRQWYRVSTKGTTSTIGKATGERYVPTAADVGFRLAVKVTAKLKGYHDLSVTSAPTAAVLAK